MADPSQPTPLLKLRGITHRYGPITALDALDLTLHEGDFWSVFGANGAGKSTLLGIISTLVSPTRGLVQWELPGWNRGLIGLVSHQTMLYDELTGLENLLFYGGLYGLEDLTQRAVRLGERLGLEGALDFPVATYSRGMRQRLTLARALLPEPRLLLLDEPFTGLDRQGSLSFAQLLREVGSGPQTVLLVTHDLPLGYDLASRLLVLRRGRQALQSKRTELTLERLEQLCFDSRESGALGV